MPICPICDDTGLLNSDSSNPEFCYCSAGKNARRQWEVAQAAERQNQKTSQAPSYIDIASLDQVNASVEAMRASLFGTNVETTPGAPGKHPAVQLLHHVAHVGHEVTAGEATQLHDLAKVLESFLGGLGPIGRNVRR